MFSQGYQSDCYPLWSFLPLGFQRVNLGTVTRTVVHSGSSKAEWKMNLCLIVLCLYLFRWFSHGNCPLQCGAFCLRKLMTKVINPWGQSDCQVDWGWKYSLSCNVLYNWVHFIRHFLIIFFPAPYLTHVGECAVHSYAVQYRYLLETSHRNTADGCWAYMRMRSFLSISEGTVYDLIM